MCFQENFSQRMDAGIWKTALLPVYPHVSRVLIQGGEPTVMKECKELIALVLSMNPSARFGVMTNGLLFNEYWRETFVEHGYEVNFSLNGASPLTHEAINVNSKYGKVMDNIARLIELRNARAGTLTIYLSFVIISENVHEIADFIELASRLGVNARFFYDATRIPEAGESDKVREEVERSFAVVKTHRDRILVEGLAAFYRHYCRNRGIENQLSHEKESAPPKCMAPWRGLNVDRLGQVRFCCMSNLMLGDLNRNDIHEIWNGHRAQMFRKRMAVDDYRYCQAACILNVKPNYALDYVKVDYYVRKFVTEFRGSPTLAYRKAVRKIRQFV
jgi:MoaA/NifB/PqqE/SkfB family radical SAM enzyme